MSDDVTGNYVMLGDAVFHGSRKSRKSIKIFSSNLTILSPKLKWLKLY